MYDRVDGADASTMQREVNKRRFGSGVCRWLVGAALLLAIVLMAVFAPGHEPP